MEKILYTLCVYLLLGGCMLDLEPSEWAEAEEQCETNGGIEWVSAVVVRCKNGAKFDR